MVRRLAQLSWKDWGVPALLFVSAQVELWVSGAPDGLSHGPTPPFCALLIQGA